MNDTPPEAPTPRTDANIDNPHSIYLMNDRAERHDEEGRKRFGLTYIPYVVNADFARQLERDLSTALNQLRQAREENETMRRALENARAGFIDCAKTLEQYHKPASRDVALAYACDVGCALTTSAPKGEQG